jgi:hypothetical protein
LLQKIFSEEYFETRSSRTFVAKGVSSLSESVEPSQAIGDVAKTIKELEAEGVELIDSQS